MVIYNKFKIKVDTFNVDTFTKELSRIEISTIANILDNFWGAQIHNAYREIYSLLE